MSRERSRRRRSRAHDRVALAMAAVPRVAFLPDDVRDDADLDVPLPIGHGSTNSQPSTVAAMLALLDVPPGAAVLDVGSGSGWTTAILAELVGPDGRVLGVELEAALVERSRAAVDTVLAGRDTVGRAEFRQAVPGVLGAPDAAPFDRVLVSAMADHTPADLVRQLRPGGVMVVPVGGTMRRVVRDDDDEGTHESVHGGYRFVPLR